VLRYGEKLSLAPRCVYHLVRDLPVVNQDLTILGNWATLERSYTPGLAGFTILTVDSGTLAVSRLNFRHGNGAIAVNGYANAPAEPRFTGVGPGWPWSSWSFPVCLMRLPLSWLGRSGPAGPEADLSGVGRPQPAIIAHGLARYGPESAAYEALHRRYPETPHYPLRPRRSRDSGSFAG
jgi:hypothetical protein